MGNVRLYEQITLGIFQSLKCRTMYPNSIPTRYGAMRQYGFTYVKEPASIPLALQQQNYSHITWYPQNCCDPLVYWILKFLILPAVITFLQATREDRTQGWGGLLSFSLLTRLSPRNFPLPPRKHRPPPSSTHDIFQISLRRSRFRQKRCPFGTGLNCWSLRGVRLTRVKVTWTNMSP